jgi:hypothetical protein
MQDENNNSDIKFWGLLLLVIFQAVVLGTKGLVTKSKTVLNTQAVETEKTLVNPIVNPAKTFNNELYFSPKNLSLKKGEKTNVDVYLMADKQEQIGGIDIVLSYNPSLVEISEVETNNSFPLVVNNKEKTSEGKMIWTFLDDKENGVSLKGSMKVLTFSVMALSKGQGEIGLLVSDKGASTVITENKTGQKILFEKSALELVISN